VYGASLPGPVQLPLLRNYEASRMTSGPPLSTCPRSLDHSDQAELFHTHYRSVMNPMWQLGKQMGQELGRTVDPNLYLKLHTGIRSGS